jgi:carboxymethylenebutenolidase
VIVGRDEHVSVGSDTMPIYLAEPEGTPRAAVVVLQEAFGVNAHIRDIADRFARAGFRAVAPHLFHRSGDPELGYEDMQEVMPYIMQLQGDQLEADVKATLELLAGRGFRDRQVGIVGFCMGGTVSFFAGCRWPLGAAVTFYGGGVAQGRFGLPSQLELAPTLQAPWLGLYGDQDPSIPVADVEDLRRALEHAAPTTEIVRYAEANHGFHCDVRSSYHEASAQDAWARTIAWFGTHLS